MSNNKDKLYVEKRDQGDHPVRCGGSQRASDVLPTQREAIDRVRELNPGNSPVVEWVKHTNVGSRTSGVRPEDSEIPGVPRRPGFRHCPEPSGSALQILNCLRPCG
jgi:hypothetical protein